MLHLLFFFTKTLEGQGSNAHTLSAPEAQKAHIGLSSLLWVKVWQVLSLWVYKKAEQKKFIVTLS